MIESKHLRNEKQLEMFSQIDTDMETHHKRRAINSFVLINAEHYIAAPAIIQICLVIRYQLSNISPLCHNRINHKIPLKKPEMELQSTNSHPSSVKSVRKISLVCTSTQLIYDVKIFVATFSLLKISNIRFHPSHCNTLHNRRNGKSFDF